jgi:hypothetical protein
MTDRGDPDVAIMPALNAFRRGTKRSRLRVFVAACKNGHTLLEVFPTSSGPVALWSSRERWGTGEAGEVITHSPARVLWHTSFVFDEDDEGEDSADQGWRPAYTSPRVSVFCRCTEATLIDLDWVQEMLETDTKRAVVPD